MALRVYEYTGQSFSNGRRVAAQPLLPLAVQSVNIGSSASTAALLGGNTNIVTLDADAGCYVLAGSSASTSVVTSTNAVRVPANVALTFGVAPYSRLTVLST